MSDIPTRRSCDPAVNPGLPDIHPQTGDKRCPNCGEYVNRVCWLCGRPRDLEDQQ